jgi:phage FluMu protein gp41
MPNTRKPKASTAKVVAAIKRMSIKPRPRRVIRKPRAKSGSQLLRRASQKIPRISAPCVIKDVERLTTISIPTTTTAGQLLYSIAANPMNCPRLSATASQFDSWYGAMFLEVETTGNAFSKDFVVIRHLANGDPSRIPTVASTLLNLAETSERKGEQARLQLDCNKRASVSAIWSESYNPRKPIIDTDPSECNLGQFIIVSNGSPGTDSVSLVVRMRYVIHFFSPIYEPWVYDTSKVFISGGTGISNSNLFGSAPVITGNGSETVSANTITFPKAGPYTMAYYAVGTSVGAPSATFTGASSISPYSNVNTTGLASANWDFVAAANATVTFTQSGTITYCRVEISPN